LNSPDRLYAQSRVHGYNIHEMSKAEDFVVVEDMVTQPRVEPGGGTFEYGPTYELLHAISDGKPIVAVTLAGGDYHTAPNLVRLAMAESAAHGASYLSWPTWPEDQRQRMASSIRPQADLLRKNEELLNEAPARADVVLFLPFRRWVETDHCIAADLAAAMSRANLQYRVISEDNFADLGESVQPPVLLVESRSVLAPAEAERVTAYEQTGGRVVEASNPDWLNQVQHAVRRPSLTVNGPPTIRAVLRDQPSRSILHLYNLNVERISSFDDRVTPATNLNIEVRVSMSGVCQVKSFTADRNGTAGALKFTARKEGGETLLAFGVPRVDVSAIIVITP
jgi:hypothetical protein